MDTTQKSELGRQSNYLSDLADLFLLPRLQFELSDMLSERRIKDAERMPNSVI